MDGLLMRHLARHLGIVAAIAAVTLFGHAARAADPLVPHDKSVYGTEALVGMACAKCHSYNGISISPLFPILAAQQPLYIENQLRLFRLRARSDPHAQGFMWGIAQRLDDDQIEALAKYFSSQPPAVAKPSRDPALAAKGKAIYENGVPEREILGCIGCHGPNAAGINQFPRLAGQHRDYLALQVQQFHGLRRESQIMYRFVENITEDEIAAVSEYLASK
jgi:cytochrome c553